MSDIYELTEQQLDIRELARQIAVRDIKPIRESLDEQEKFPWEVVKKVAEKGRSVHLIGVFMNVHSRDE